MSNFAYSHHAASSVTSQSSTIFHDTAEPDDSPHFKSQHDSTTAATETPIASGPRSTQDLHAQCEVGEPSVGLPADKAFFNVKEALGVLGSLLLLLLALVVVAPGTSIPPRLGYTRQLQVLGVLLSLINKCLLIVSPKFFFVMECRWGKSTLQNYDAILRNSFFVSQMSNLWRSTILIFIIAPLLLEYGYKAPIFQGATGSMSYEPPVGPSTHFYGIAGPPGLETNDTGSGWSTIGVSYMSNSSIPWFSATKSSTRTTPLPPFPAPYGFNMLMLSETSTAMLDIPMPEYVNALQERLLKLNNIGTFMISATVHATVTTNNETVEAHRNDTAFWDTFEPNEPYGATRTWQTGPDGQNIDLLVNEYHGDSSWCFLDFHPIAYNISAEQKFRENALMFTTRREICNATWSLTSEKLQLTSGECTLQSPDADQSVYSNGFQFQIFYMASLTEFLARWALPYNSTSWLPPMFDRDPWLIPSFTTVVASMYWSRTTASFGYYSWRNKTLLNPLGNDVPFNKSELYYPASVTGETLAYQAPVITQHSWLLYFILAVQTGLCLLFYLLGFIQYDSPLDSNFGMISLLAGVRPSTLPLLKGASISGELSRPLRVQIHTEDIPQIEIEHNGETKAGAQVEYELGGQGRNGYLSHPWFSQPTSSMLADIRQLFISRKRRFPASARDFSQAEEMQMSLVEEKASYKRL